MHARQFLQQRTGIDDQTERGETLTPLLNMYKAQMQFCMFLGLFSNAHYQIINGLESVVEGSTEAKHTPVVAVTFTVGVRFSNNVYGEIIEALKASTLRLPILKSFDLKHTVHSAVDVVLGMASSQRQNSIIIVGGGNMRGWPEK
ncbi:hypothetical protein Bca52824_010803 [Brassica carinata]|uniref:Uncharacterized protein n=1 Tax=Brassica carinata TaxID=52824 RepID=A0A8X8BAH4_BRACI|nr:hypothetical protein Bca52824_010803 [Brassica carinata]